MFIFLDTETTGVGEPHRLCQLAYKTDSGIACNELFQPPVRITCEAMSIHHITNEMVAGKPPFAGSDAEAQLRRLLENEDAIVVAHNAKFDVEMLNREGIHPGKVVCTLKLARFLDKDSYFKKYTLQYLRYKMGLQLEVTAHDAMGDVLVLEGVFERIQKRMEALYPGNAVEQMLAISKKPALIRVIPFGKYRGWKIEDVFKDDLPYLQWMMGTDIDEDIRYSIQLVLEGVS